MGWIPVPLLSVELGGYAQGFCICKMDFGSFVSFVQRGELRVYVEIKPLFFDTAKAFIA